MIYHLRLVHYRSGQLEFSLDCQRLPKTSKISKPFAAYLAGLDKVCSRIKQIRQQKFTCSPTLWYFHKVGSLFRQVGSLMGQSLRSQVSGSPLECRPSDRTASSSSIPFSSAKFKIAVSLCAAGTQRMADTFRRVQRRYILFSIALSSC